MTRTRGQPWESATPNSKRRGVYLGAVTAVYILWRTHGVVVGSTTTDNSDPAFFPIPPQGIESWCSESDGDCFHVSSCR